MDINRIFLIIILILTFEGIFSQKLILKFTPSYSFSFGTYRSKVTSQNESIELLNNSFQKNINFSHGSFGWDVSFFENKKITYGISFFTGGATTRLIFNYKSSQDSFSNLISEITLMQGNGTYIKQKGLFLNYSLVKDSVNRKLSLVHSFSLYGYLLKDKTFYQPLMDDTVYMTDGVLESNYENNKARFEGRRGLALMFRYDASIYFNSKNVINFFISFQQGFKVMDKISLIVNHSNGAYLSANSTSRGSLLCIGIAKPITIYPWNSKVSKDFHF